jgi:hypothetical protein
MFFILILTLRFESDICIQRECDLRATSITGWLTGLCRILLLVSRRLAAPSLRICLFSAAVGPGESIDPSRSIADRGLESREFEFLIAACSSLWPTIPFRMPTFPIKSSEPFRSAVMSSLPLTFARYKFSSVCSSSGLGSRQVRLSSQENCKWPYLCPRDQVLP